MAKKATTAPSRTCADCFHFFACHLWAVSISTDVAPKCPQFEPVRYVSLADLHEMHQMEKGNLVPVVRCKDCKHRESPYSCPMRKLVMPFSGAGAFEDCTEDDGYCHLGAKMDGGAEA